MLKKMIFLTFALVLFSTTYTLAAPPTHYWSFDSTDASGNFLDSGTAAAGGHEMVLNNVVDDGMLQGGKFGNYMDLTGSTAYGVVDGFNVVAPLNTPLAASLNQHQMMEAVAGR